MDTKQGCKTLLSIVTGIRLHGFHVRGYFATFKMDFSVISVFFIDYRLQFEG